MILVNIALRLFSMQSRCSCFTAAFACALSITSWMLGTNARNSAFIIRICCKSNSGFGGSFKTFSHKSESSGTSSSSSVGWFQSCAPCKASRSVTQEETEIVKADSLTAILFLCKNLTTISIVGGEHTLANFRIPLLDPSVKKFPEQGYLGSVLPQGFPTMIGKMASNFPASWLVVVSNACMIINSLPTLSCASSTLPAKCVRGSITPADRRGKATKEFRSPVEKPSSQSSPLTRRLISRYTITLCPAGVVVLFRTS
mmetsp:Transcript_46457/g.97215  ORF Transcript_46457/g.97215 Transcript_46457/m.97215 type:complete len:257 (-) Transcript_46457:8109-8879(-)